jgi:hypothetical protein
LAGVFADMAPLTPHVGVALGDGSCDVWMI